MPASSERARNKSAQSASHETLELRINRVGATLRARLARILEQVPGADSGPQRLASELKLDKVLTSRLLKAVRSDDAMSVIHRAPGPDPLRRVVRASVRHGVKPDDISAAYSAVDEFEELIRADVGDRSSLEAILSSWVPEARRDFELRRKQAAFRAISQLKGMQADVFAETAIFWPSDDPQRMDVVWIKAVTGLARLRPSAVVKFTSKRGVESPDRRRPLTLAGEPIETVKNTVIADFCTEPAPEVTARVMGEQTHYLLERVNLGDSVRIVTVEVNRAEIPRFVAASRGRRAWASSDVTIPAQRLQFDMLVHPECFPGEHPDLRVYDTTILGTADRNDPAREIDVLDIIENVDQLGVGIARFGSSDVPRYRQLVEHVFEQLGFDPALPRGYRVATDYPVHGSQYVMSFRTTGPPAASA